MHLAHLRLRDFRNYPRLDADFAPGFHLLLGDNAQGKTNILEAVYLMATLRSFRGVGGAKMIRHGQKGYFVGGSVVGGTIPSISLASLQGGEGGARRSKFLPPTNPSPQPSPRLGGERETKILASHSEREVKIYWSARERKLALDGQPVKRLGDYLGVLRAVVFCTEDLQLVKGAAPAPAAVPRFAARPKPSRPTCRCYSVTAGRPRPQRAAQALPPWRDRRAAGQLFAGTCGARR